MSLLLTDHPRSAEGSPVEYCRLSRVVSCVIENVSIRMSLNIAVLMYVHDKLFQNIANIYLLTFHWVPPVPPPLSFGGVPPQSVIQGSPFRRIHNSASLFPGSGHTERPLYSAMQGHNFLSTGLLFVISEFLM